MVTKIDINIPYYQLSITNKEDIDNIIRIIRNWKEIYNDISTSTKEYYIIIYSNEIVKYSFNNSFPKDFYKLNEYLGDKYGR